VMLAHVMAAAFGVLVAQADLPNANLPGNSATLPNSNLPGPVTTDQPIMLPNTDSSGYWITERMFQQQAQQRYDEHLGLQQQTMQLAAKALDEAEKANANAADTREIQQKQLQLQEQQAAQQQAAQQQQAQQPKPASQQQP
jgi:hypothetical protein